MLPGMKLSAGIEWAVHCCVVLSQADGPVTAPRLAEFHGISRTYLAKHLQQLSRAGEPLEIHSAQMLLLTALASSPNRAVSRDNLLARARGRDHDALDRSIDVQVLRLRQIVEADPSKPRFIKTVWGVGYMLVADVES